MAVNVKTYAKLNFTLDITGVRNGFHTLDSLVCTVDLYDLIKLTKRKDGRVSIEMHGMGTETLSYEMNNAAKAAERYIEHFGTCGADIKIYKNIPVGGGLGGVRRVRNARVARLGNEPLPRQIQMYSIENLYSERLKYGRRTLDRRR